MPRPVHFEIHADDLDRAGRFYTELLGWQFQKWDGPVEYRMIVTGPDGQPGINGGLMQRMGPPPADGQPVNAFVCAVDIDSVDRYVGRTTELGGSVAVPKMAVPGVGWLAYIKDTEGNLLGLFESDEGAK